MFAGCTVSLDSKEIKLGSSDQKTSSSAGKKYWGNFSAMFVHGSGSLQLFPVMYFDFLISSMVLGLPDQLQIFSQLYLKELGLLIGLGLLKL